MTPQASVMYAAPLRPGAAPVVHALLQSMNTKPGVYDPANPLLPLHKLAQVHFARMLVVRDLAAEDRAVYSLPVDGLPDYLVFLAEIDGDHAAFRDDFARVAEPGLRTLLAHTEDFTEGQSLQAWMRRAHVSATASYVNWLGRTVVQVREEEALRRALRSYLCAHRDDVRGLSAAQTRLLLRGEVQRQQQAGELSLTQAAPTPLGWRIRNLLDLVLLPLVLLLLSPLVLVALPFLLFQIRRWERTGPRSGAARATGTRRMICSRWRTTK